MLELEGYNTAGALLIGQIFDIHYIHRFAPIKLLRNQEKVINLSLNITEILIL